jgi:sec-independent protein translocase protein TatA
MKMRRPVEWVATFVLSVFVSDESNTIGCSFGVFRNRFIIQVSSNSCRKEVEMPFGIQPIHLVVIVIVALIIFGPQRLPEIGRGLGRALNEFRKGTREMTEGFREEVTKASNETPAPTPPPPATGNSCSKCGTANLADARFCKNCGAQLSV